MYQFSVKITLISVACFLLSNCNSVKKVKEDQHLLTQNAIYVNGALTKNKKLYNYLLQQPNQKLLKTPIKLHLYNWARDNADSVYVAKLNQKPLKKKFLARLLSKKQVNRYIGRKYNFNEWLKRTGEAPTIVNTSKIKKSKKRLEGYFWNRGWFNVSSTHELVYEDSLKASVNYHIKTEEPYSIKSFETNIASKDADSIYDNHKKYSSVSVGKQYDTQDLELERNRITSDFRNNGLFYFERDYVKFDADTINNNKNIKLRLTIDDRKVGDNESIAKEPFKVRKISRVKIYTDSNFKNTLKQVRDTTVYNGFELYSYDKLKYKPKALTNAVFLAPNAIYSDNDRLKTYNAISNLGVFKYPTISFKESLDNDDLIASIYLTPRKKYVFGTNFNVSTSTIQDIGIGLEGSLSIRNVFRRAETLELSARSNLGSSQEVAESDNRFFNISEFGLDVALKFPRIVFPLNTDKIIDKSSAPLTTIKVGVSQQKNIGLDKQNVTGVFGYKWKPNQTFSNELNLFKLQYVRNSNEENYFNIYRNSFDRINEISKSILDANNAFFGKDGNLDIPKGGVDRFLNEALSGSFTNLSMEDFIDLRNLSDRRDRLIEENLILSAEYNFIKDTRKNLYDEEFTRFRMKFESAGTLLSQVAEIIDRPRNENDKFQIYDVEFSQFFKVESEIIKHWDLGKKRVVAVRAFGGLAIPYGNSNSIPFSQSYFGGGSNDNRGWTAYDLGPGSSSGRNEFNEANFKLAFNAEYRFSVIGNFNGAIFTDLGNIWNIYDSFEDEKDVTFSGIEDLNELALGTGIGFRYDFSFFVVRLDAAIKAHNPALERGDRWFNNTQINKIVYNIGINYPF